MHRYLRSALLVLAACGAPPAVGSIGAVLGRDPETREVYVREVPGADDDTPARSTLIPGDQLVMVEGTFVRDLPTKELRALLRGEPGTEVAVTVVRGGEVLRLRVKRAALKPRLSLRKEERLEE